MFAWGVDESESEMMAKKEWDDIFEGSLWELGIRPGYTIIVDENTGETKIISEKYLKVEQEGNQHLKLLHIIKEFELQCPTSELASQYYKEALGESEINKLLQGICLHYPYRMNEHRILCETWLTDDKHIFINGELEGIRGVDYTENCNICETIKPSYFFQQPKDMMDYANIRDPLVNSFFEVIKNNAKMIMNDDILYNEISETDIIPDFVSL